MQCAILPREKVILWQDCITWWEFSLCKVDDIQTGHFLPPSYLFKQTPNSLLICTWILKIKLEISSSMNWIFSLQSISKLIFAGYTSSKNQVPNRVKIQHVELDFSKLIFQKWSTYQQGASQIDWINFWESNQNYIHQVL